MTRRRQRREYYKRVQRQLSVTDRALRVTLLPSTTLTASVSLAIHRQYTWTRVHCRQRKCRSNRRLSNVFNEVYGQHATGHNATDKNNPGQNATRKIDSRTKCHPRNERPDEIPLARALHVCKLNESSISLLTNSTVLNVSNKLSKNI